MRVNFHNTAANSKNDLISSPQSNTLNLTLFRSTLLSSSLCPLVTELTEVLMNLSLVPRSMDVVLMPLQPD